VWAQLVQVDHLAHIRLWPVSLGGTVGGLISHRVAYVKASVVI
jgi:hypothetical protein